MARMQRMPAASAADSARPMNTTPKRTAVSGSKLESSTAAETGMKRKLAREEQKAATVPKATMEK